VGYHVYLGHGTSVCWYIKTRLESGPVTADLTTTVIHSYKLLINNAKFFHSLISNEIQTVLKSHITSILKKTVMANPHEGKIVCTRDFPQLYLKFYAVGLD